MSLKGIGKRFGKTKDIRPAPTATHPIEEPINNSLVMAEKQLKKSSKRKTLGRFDPKDNAQFK